MKLSRRAPRRRRLRVALAGWLVLAGGACEQREVAPPKDFVGSLGRLVIDGSQSDEFRFVAQAAAGGPAPGAIAVAPSVGAPFAETIAITTTSLPPDLFDVRLEAPTQRPVERNEACWLRFHARAATPQAGTELARLGVAVRTTTGRTRDLLAQTLYLPTAWAAIDLPLRVPLALETGAAAVVFGLGSRPQAIELGGLMLRCFAPDVALEDLPQTRFTYAGRAPDAPWRTAALDRIAAERERTLEVSVRDAAGQPAAGAEVHVQMVRHGFAFGAAVDAELLAGQGPGGGPSQYGGEDTARYRQILGELFNAAAFDSALLWKPWLDPAQRQVTDAALAWIDALELELVGRALVRASWTELPPQLGIAQGDAAAVRAALRQRVTEAAGQLKDRIAYWAVLDQPRDHHELIDTLGQDEVDQWFRLAREAAPQARLLVNETAVLEGDHLDGLLTLLQGLRAREVPLDGVGIELRITGQPPPLELVGARLDTIAALGLPVLITALEIDSADAALQADYLRDLLILLYGHPGVEGVLLGGFWAGRQRAPDAALYGRDWQIKPNAEAYRDLVFAQWWTDRLAAADAGGRLTTTGHVGDYQISARRGEQATTQTVTLGEAGANVTLTLPE
jgi:hypothetical protein